MASRLAALVLIGSIYKLTPTRTVRVRLSRPIPVSYVLQCPATENCKWLVVMPPSSTLVTNRGRGERQGLSSKHLQAARCTAQHHIFRLQASTRETFQAILEN